MDYGVYRYEEPYGYPRQRRRINYFAWTVVILLLTGFTFAAWLLSFYIFGQPERPESYHILQKLHKIDPPKRFELTAAPKGEFLDAKQIFDRYSAMGAAALAKTNAELARAYIRNFQQVRGLIPYIVGRFVIMDARELGPQDVFTSGMTALTSAVENGEVLMEHVYPADPPAVPLMRQTLSPGLEIKLERTHDLSAVIHVQRLNDGRIMVTAVPLLYGTYTVTRGTGTFTLEPPTDLNLAAGWPLYKEQTRLKAELRFAENRRETTGAAGPPPITGLAPTGSPPPPQNALVRVEQAKPVEAVVAQVTPKNGKGAPPKPTPPGKKGRLAKNQKATPPPAPSPAASQPSAPVVAQQTTKPTAPPAPQPAAAKSAVPAATAPPVAAMAPALAVATPPTAPSASPTDSANALASTAGGGTWKTFPAGKMPLGRLIAPSDLKDLADRGMTGERLYLKGQFVVNASDANHAVLRPRTRLATAMLHLGGSNSTRIVVEFPAGYTPPAQGSVVNRDEARPLEITEVRKQEDGQLNVFAREIMQ